MPPVKKNIGPLVLLLAFVLALGCDSGGSGMNNNNDPTDTDTIPDPTLSSISPTTGGIGTELSIQGSKFQSNASVTIDGKTAENIEVASSGQIYADVPSGIQDGTPVSVTILNPPDSSATADSAYTAIAPELAFVNSATRPSGQVGSTVILDGDAFGDVDIQSNAQVLFSDGSGGSVAASIQSSDDWTETFIVTTVPSGAEDGPVRVKTDVGGSNSIPFDVTDGASFSPSKITWTQTSALPTPTSGHQAAFAAVEGTNSVKRYVYVTGGRDSLNNALNQVLYGQIDQQGDVTSWSSSGSLPNARSFHESVTATRFNSRVQGNGFIYVLGGTDSAGDPVSSVAKAPINDDGSVGRWNTEQSLPQPLHSAGAAIFRSAIYVVGGATGADQPVQAVYRAEIDTTGQIGSWTQETTLPSARAYHGLSSFGGYLYSVGGETGSEAPDNGDYNDNSTKLTEVVYGEINLRSGQVDSWTVNSNSLGKARSKHSTLVSGGVIFLSSGLYAAAGNGSSENVYGQINSDGSVGEFNGATGSNTLQSEGGTNLFNAAHISYVDSDGVAHVMIIGGDDVNEPGNKQPDVLYY